MLHSSSLDAALRQFAPCMYTLCHVAYTYIHYGNFVSSWRPMVQAYKPNLLSPHICTSGEMPLHSIGGFLLYLCVCCLQWRSEGVTLKVGTRKWGTRLMELAYSKCPANTNDLATPLVVLVYANKVCGLQRHRVSSAYLLVLFPDPQYSTHMRVLLRVLDQDYLLWHKPSHQSENGSHVTIFGQSAQAAIYTLSKRHGIHIYKHFGLHVVSSCTFVFKTRIHACRKPHTQSTAWPLLLIGADTKW